MTTCQLCQMYLGSLPQDHEYHDRHHAELMEPIEPRVHSDFLKAVEDQGNLVHLDHSSSRSLQHELFMRGKLFKEELDLDGTYWFSEGNEEKDAHGFLFNDETGEFGHGSIVGGCVVRWRGYEDNIKRWWLDWAWIAPSLRQTGIFSRHLAKLSERFEGLQLQHYHLHVRKLHEEKLAVPRAVSQ